jgi:hypothetical protein
MNISISCATCGFNKQPQQLMWIGRDDIRPYCATCAVKVKSGTIHQVECHLADDDDSEISDVIESQLAASMPANAKFVPLGVAR